MPKPTTVSPLEIRPLLGKRIRAAKASFYLGMLLFLAGFLGIVFGVLDGLAMTTPLAAIAGFVLGLYYLVLGMLWASLWALLIQLHALLEDLAAWVSEALATVATALRGQFLSGVIVDFTIVESQIEQLVATQTERWASTENQWVPLVRQWAPPVAKQGLKVVVMRVADGMWSADQQITIDALERRLHNLSLKTTSESIRTTLWFATLGWAILAILLTGLPYALFGTLQLLLG